MCGCDRSCENKNRNRMEKAIGISHVGVLYLIYSHRSRGRIASEWEVAVNQILHDVSNIIISLCVGNSICAHVHACYTAIPRALYLI